MAFIGLRLDELQPATIVTSEPLPGGAFKQHLTLTLTNPATGEVSPVLTLHQTNPEDAHQVHLLRDGVAQWLKDLGFQVEANNLLARDPGQV